MATCAQNYSFGRLKVQEIKLKAILHYRLLQKMAVVQLLLLMTRCDGFEGDYVIINVFIVVIIIIIIIIVAQCQQLRLNLKRLICNDNVWILWITMQK